MKNFFKTIFSRPILLVFIFIMILYLPTGISSAPEGLKRQHASTVGIDFAEEGLEVSLLSYISTQSQTYQEKYLLISGKGPNVAKAIAQIENITGRQVALTHATVIVISEEIALSGAEKVLDFFYRNENLSNNAEIICAKGSAKDVLKLEQQVVNTTNVGLEELAIYNSNSVFFFNTDLESFYRGYFSPTKCSLLGIVTLGPNPDHEQENQSGGASGSSGESGSSGGGGGGTNGDIGSKRIVNFETLGVFKSGKLIATLDINDIKGTNVINPKSKNVDFEIKNVSDEIFENVNISFNVVSNSVNTKAFFENDKPVIEYSTLLGISITEIVSAETVKYYFENDIDYLTPTVINKIESICKERFSTMLLKLIKNKSDVLGIYSNFVNQTNKKFLDWYNNLEDQEDFLSQIEYRLIINPILTK